MLRYLVPMGCVYAQKMNCSYATLVKYDNILHCESLLGFWTKWAIWKQLTVVIPENINQSINRASIVWWNGATLQEKQKKPKIVFYLFILKNQLMRNMFCNFGLEGSKQWGKDDEWELLSLSLLQAPPCLDSLSVKQTWSWLYLSKTLRKAVSHSRSHLKFHCFYTEKSLDLRLINLCQQKHSSSSLTLTIRYSLRLLSGHRTGRLLQLGAEPSNICSACFSDELQIQMSRWLKPFIWLKSTEV